MAEIIIAVIAIADYKSRPLREVRNNDKERKKDEVRESLTEDRRAKAASPRQCRGRKKNCSSLRSNRARPKKSIA